MDTPFARYRAALAWAIELHGSTPRKSWPAPLLAHLLSVSALVLDDGGDDDQAIGALLHDALVYGGCDLAAIEGRFGARVAEIARDASDTRQAFDPGPRPPWLERRLAHIAGMASLGEAVVLVTVADKAQECSEWCLELERRPQLAESLPGGVEPLAWYYGALHSALAARCPGSRSLLILGQACRGLRERLLQSQPGAAEAAGAAGAAGAADPATIADWLAAYPQRHQPALFV